MLKARAVENMAYVIGVNIIGIDGNNHAYSGHSQVVDFLGNYLLEPQISEEIVIVDLDKNKMLEARQKLGFLKDRDTFSLF